MSSSWPSDDFQWAMATKGSIPFARIIRKKNIGLGHTQIFQNFMS